MSLEEQVTPAHPPDPGTAESAQCLICIPTCCPLTACLYKSSWKLPLPHSLASRMVLTISKLNAASTCNLEVLSSLTIQARCSSSCHTWKVELPELGQCTKSGRSFIHWDTTHLQRIWGWSWLDVCGPKLGSHSMAETCINELIQQFEVHRPTLGVGDVGLVNCFKQALNPCLHENNYQPPPMPRTWAEWKHKASILDNQWRWFNVTHPQANPAMPPSHPALPLSLPSTWPTPCPLQAVKQPRTCSP